MSSKMTSINWGQFSMELNYPIIIIYDKLNKQAN